MEFKDRIKQHLPLISILLFAFLLRIYRFRSGETLIHSDEALFYQYAIKPVIALLHATTPQFIFEQLFRYFNFNWGWGFLLYSTFFTFVQTIFGIPITEFTINLPYVFLGSATVILVYYLCAEMGSPRGGLIAAFITSIFPYHVSSSRSIGLHGVATAFMFMLTLLLFINYFKTGKNKLYAYLSLAFFFATDFQFLVILPVIFVAGILYSKRSVFDVALDLLDIKGALLFFAFNTPIIAAGVYLARKGWWFSSYLAKPFNKQHYFGFFLNNVLHEFEVNFGELLLITLSIGFAYGCYRAFNGDVTSRFLASWFGITILPFIFVIDPTQTFFNSYINHTLFAVILLGSIGIAELLKSAKQLPYKNAVHTILILAALIVTASTLYINANSLYGIGEPTTLHYLFSGVSPMSGINESRYYYEGTTTQDSAKRYYFGRVSENTGMKTIGYYVRNALPPNETIFIDEESFTTHYYFGRDVYSDLDLTTTQMLEFYKSLQEKSIHPDWISVSAVNEPTFSEILKSYQQCVIATLNGKPIRSLYTRRSCKPTSLAVEAYDPAFDRQFGDIKSLFYNYE